MGKQVAQALQAALTANDRVGLIEQLSAALTSGHQMLLPELEQQVHLPFCAELNGQQLARLCHEAARSANPAQSLVRLLAFAATAPVPVSAWAASGRRALAAVFGGSQAAGQRLLAQPSLAGDLCRGLAVTHARSPQAMRDALRHCRAKAPSGPAFEAAVRHYRSGEWIRIVARALAGLGGVEDVLRELSDLADAVVDVCTRFHLRRARSQGGPWVTPAAGRTGFAVVAQGKLGGRELNVSSDIDLQFIYDRPEGHDSATSDLQGRYAAVARRLIHALSHSDGAALGYRVDVDLRPEGKKGPLINAVAAAETYYASWGQAWERLALIRARHISGAAWVTKAFLRGVHSFIYPRHVALDTVQKVRDIAVRIATTRRQQSLQAGDDGLGVDIKRDRGGIRDVELFVQTLQHLHGGRHPSLQTGSLTRALENLQLGGVLPLKVCLGLRHSYLFLRDVENCLQADEERQTHCMPSAPPAQAYLAGQLRLCGGVADLQHSFNRARRIIRRTTQPLFKARLHRTLSRPALALCQTGEAQAATLQALGFRALEEVQGALQVICMGHGGPFCTTTLNPSPPPLGVALLGDMAHSPDPDQALRLYTDLDPHLRRHRGYLELLTAAPAVRRRLMDLFGTSVFLGQTLVQFPELLDWLAHAHVDTAHHPLPAGADTGADAYVAQIQPRLQRFAGDVDLQMRVVCRFKLREQLRIGLLDIAGALPIEQVSARLAGLAEACVRTTLTLARIELAQSATDVAAGRTTPALKFVIIAMGGLGSSELGYGSDLDLLFVYAPDPTGDVDFQANQARRLAQRCIARLTQRQPEGVLYPIDTRLRPSGNQGPLVTTAAACIAYYQTQAMVWECQALLRARCVAGDVALGADVLTQLQVCRYPPCLPATAWPKIQQMRQRMQIERGQMRPSDGRSTCRTDIRMGPGGLVDLEFAVQALQLRYAHQYPALRQTHPAQALEALGQVGLLSVTRAAHLQAAYWFLRRLESGLRIVYGRPLSVIDFAHPAAHTLARRLGYAARRHPTAALQRDWQRITRRVHRFYCAVLQPHNLSTDS